MWLRRYGVALLSGVGVFLVVDFIDAALASARLHAESTYIDDLLLAFIVGVLVYILQRHHDRELLRQRQCALVIEKMNHHIRNALQLLVMRANAGPQTEHELGDIRNSVERIDWALREILPLSAGRPVLVEPEWQKGPMSESPELDSKRFTGRAG